MLPPQPEITTKIYQWPPKAYPVHSVNFNGTTVFIQRAANVRDWHEVVYNGEEWIYEDGNESTKSSSLLAQTKADAIQELVKRYC